MEAKHSHVDAPVKTAPQVQTDVTALKGEIVIDSPLIGKVKATEGIAYMVVGFLGIAVVMFIYFKFKPAIHARISKTFRRRK